jgi:hypothetical protein
VRQHVDSYWYGAGPRSTAEIALRWREIEHAVPGYRITLETPVPDVPEPPPFVYENPDAPHLRALRERYDLPGVIAGAANEYDAILKLAAWVGTRFDHGTDPTVGGDKACDPVGLIEAGRSGQRYWCEIAARLMVHAATSLGWPSRIVTASTDGYTWEHAVAEIWSTQLRKWVLVDTDFNVVYEVDGAPLSAVDVLRLGHELQRNGQLHIREFAPPKPHIPTGGDTIALYRYIHVDMRTDWCTRRLARGSPAGGDVATWWTGVASLHPLLTARAHRDFRSFAVPGDYLAATPVSASADPSNIRLRLSATAYQPFRSPIEFRVGNAPWMTLSTSTFVVALDEGVNHLELKFSDSYSAGITPSVAFDILVTRLASPRHAGHGNSPG